MATLPQAQVIPLMLSDCLSTDSSLKMRVQELRGNILAELNSNPATAKMAVKMRNQEGEGDSVHSSESALAQIQNQDSDASEVRPEMAAKIQSEMFTEALAAKMTQLIKEQSVAPAQKVRRPSTRPIY
jgi:hypothetical protein